MTAADWVGASVRARSMATRRAGVGLCRELANQPNLEAALALLSDSAYGERLASAHTLAEAQRAISETVLWELRVLAGWLPVQGTALVRAAAAFFERDNIVVRMGELYAGKPPDGRYFDLGALSTAWPSVLAATSVAEVGEAVRHSPWGDPGDTLLPGSMADVLTVSWLRRLSVAAPETHDWTRTAGALLVARAVLVDEAEPTDRLVQLLRPLIGTAWMFASDLDALRTGLPASVRASLDGINTPDDLWRAEARLVATVDAEGARLLHGSLPGPGIITGALAVLGADSAMTRAALVAACTGARNFEVIDVMA
ncbi:MAG: hypothetical protein KF761_08470 [Salinibacterium sp.]|nr:hypothetical protein [Salinibacterium sp.]